LEIAEKILAAAPASGSVNEALINFYVYFKPTDFERQRKFRTDQWKSLAAIKDLYVKIKSYDGAYLPPLMKTRNLADQFTQLFNVSSASILATGAGQAFAKALYRWDVLPEGDVAEYLAFRDKAVTEFYCLSQKPAKMKRRTPHHFPEYEDKMMQENGGAFALLCREAELFRAAINRRIVKDLYRKIRKELRNDEWRAWLLAFWPNPQMEYRIPIFNPIAMSFFLADDEITSLVVRVLILKDRSIPGEQKRLSRIWLGFLAAYPYWLLCMEEEIAEGLRTPRGRRIQPTYAQRKLKDAVALFGLSWADFRRLSKAGEEIPIAMQPITFESGLTSIDLQGAWEIPEDMPEQIVAWIKGEARLTDIEVNRLLLYAQGLNISQIARDQKVSRQAILCALKSLRSKIASKIQARDIINYIKQLDPNKDPMK
jgi:predicted DNA-binding protein (UPF0251 family)